MEEVIHRAKKIVMRNIESPKRKQANFSTEKTKEKITNSEEALKLQLREENESLKAELSKLKSELKVKDCTITELKERLNIDPKSTIDQRLIQLQQKISYLEWKRRQLERECLISSQMIRSQKALISKLECESTRMNELYSKLVNSQRNLITLLESKYNDILHSLIDSFDDIDSGSSYEAKMEEIQTDLNNLIQILGHRMRGEKDAADPSSIELGERDSESPRSTSTSSSLSIERPLNDQYRSPVDSIRSMRQMLLNEQFLAIDSKDSTYSDVSWLSQVYDESVYIDLDFNMDAVNLNQQSEDLKSKDRSKEISLESSTLLSKSDFECQCRLDENDEASNDLLKANKTLMKKLNSQSDEIKRLKEQIASKYMTDAPKHCHTARPTRTENDGLEDLINSYLSLIKTYKNLVDTEKSSSNSINQN